MFGRLHFQLVFVCEPIFFILPHFQFSFPRQCVDSKSNNFRWFWWDLHHVFFFSLFFDFCAKYERFILKTLFCLAVLASALRTLSKPTFFFDVCEGIFVIIVSSVVAHVSQFFVRCACTRHIHRSPFLSHNLGSRCSLPFFWACDYFYRVPQNGANLVLLVPTHNEAFDSAEQTFSCPPNLTLFKGVMCA